MTPPDTAPPSIAPACPTCGRADAPAVETPAWASRALFGECVGWLGADPRPGELAEIRVRHPFHARAGVPFHALFEPTEPAEDGWAEWGHLLPRMAEVEAALRVDRGPDPDWRGWRRAQVEVLSARPLEALAGSLDERPLASLERCVVYGPEHFRRFEWTRHERWVHLAWSAQGDVGGWLVIRLVERGGGLMVMAGEWGPDTAGAFTGAARVPPAAWAALEARAAGAARDQT